MSYDGAIWGDGALITVRPPVCRKGGCGHPAGTGSEWCPRHQSDVHAQATWASGLHTDRRLHGRPAGTSELHGTNYRYHAGCRCEACTAAHATYEHARRRRTA